MDLDRADAASGEVGGHLGQAFALAAKISQPPLGGDDAAQAFGLCTMLRLCSRLSFAVFQMEEPSMAQAISPPHIACQVRPRESETIEMICIAQLSTNSITPASMPTLQRRSNTELLGSFPRSSRLSFSESNIG